MDCIMVFYGMTECLFSVLMGFQAWWVPYILGFDFLTWLGYGVLSFLVVYYEVRNYFITIQIVNLFDYLNSS